MAKAKSTVPGFNPELPANLPANRQDPVYGSDLMIDLLANLGYEHVMLTPGGSFRGLHDSLVNYARNQRPQIFLCGTEDVAVSMGHGYAKASRKPALVALHDLVGLQHGLMSLFNAWADRTPLLVVGGAEPNDPGVRIWIHWLHSANGQSEAARPYTKWSDDPPNLQAVLNSIARAHRMAISAPTRPTYVSIDRVIQEEVLDGSITLPDTGHARYRPAPAMVAAPEAVAQATDLLTEAECPLIVADCIGLRPESTEPMVEIVELLGAAYQEVSDNVCLPTAHQHNLTGGYGAPETEIRKETDAFLGVDCANLADEIRAVLMARGAGRYETSRAPKVIDLSLNDFYIAHWANVGGDISPADVQLVADPIAGLIQLRDEVKRRAEGNPPWRKRAQDRAKDIAARHEALRARQRELAEADWDGTPITVPRMLHEVYQAVKDKDWVLTIRNGTSWYEGLWDFPGAGSFLGHSGGGGVGYGPGAAVGAALAAREQGRFPVAIMGDGDFTNNPSAIWTAAHYKIPLLIVILNNNSFGNDEALQMRVANERDRPPENAWIGQKMIEPTPDYAGVARSYGGWAETTVKDPGDLAGALSRAAAQVEAGSVALVDVRTRLR